MSDTRVTEYAINQIFTNRWSPRGFNHQASITTETLSEFFEAARWAPSAWNSQPWRFIYVIKGTEHWDRLFNTLSDYNKSWAVHASALILVLSKKTFLPPNQDTVVHLKSHSFDTGAAWANLALQASLKGWHTHAIGGYDQTAVSHELKIPHDYQQEAIIVVGQQGDKSHLSEALQSREQPTPRHPINKFIAEGVFQFQD